LLASAAFVVESDDICGGTRHVRDEVWFFVENVGQEGLDALVHRLPRRELAVKRVKKSKRPMSRRDC